MKSYRIDLFKDGNSRPISSQDEYLNATLVEGKLLIDAPNQKSFRLVLTKDNKVDVWDSRNKRKFYFICSN